MSGIQSDTPELIDDIPFQRYEKCIRAAQQYGLLQFGLALFTEQNQNNLKAHVFNFNIFAREIPKIYNPIFSIEPSATEFHKQHGVIDFNKIFYKGVSFFPSELKAKVQDSLFQQEEESKDSDSFDDFQKSLPEKDKQKLEYFIQQLEPLLSDPKIKQAQVSDISYFFKTSIVQLLQEKQIVYKDNYVQKEWFIERLSEQQKKLHDEEIFQSQTKKYLNMLGVIRITELIEGLQIPMVGHNCFMDFLFYYNWFIAQLPNDFQVFQKEIAKRFPLLYDTKVLSYEIYRDHLDVTTVEKIKEKIVFYDQIAPTDAQIAQVFPPIQIELDSKYSAYDWTQNEKSGRFHEAGYDAFLTGWNFIRMTHHKPLKQYEKWVGTFQVYEGLYYLTIFGNEQRKIYNDNIIHVAILLTEKQEDLPFHERKEKILDLHRKIVEQFRSSQLDGILNVRLHLYQYAIIELKLQGLNHYKDAPEHYHSIIKQLQKDQNFPQIIQLDEYIKIRKEEHAKNLSKIKSKY